MNVPAPALAWSHCHLQLVLRRRPALPVAPAQERQWGRMLLLHALGRALRRHAGAAVQIALHTGTGALPPLDAVWPVPLHVAGLDMAALEQALQRWQTEASGANAVELMGWTVPTAWQPVTPPVPDAGMQEVALALQGPLPFKRPTASRSYITAQVLLEMVQRRAQQVFGAAAPLLGLGDPAELPRLADTLELNCGHWHFVEVRRASASAQQHLSAAQRRHRLQSGGSTEVHEQSHSGCAGRLYLRGPALQQLIPWLQALQPWQLAAQGGVAVWSPCELLCPAPAAIDPLLGDEGGLQRMARETQESHDVPLDEAPPPEPALLAAELASALQHGDFEFAPTRAFELAQADGRRRTAERLQLRDLVVQRHLLALLGPVLDRGFSPASMGFRKGVSRQDAVARVSELLARGHEWVVRADIEAFFPSIAHDTVRAAVDRVLPRADVRTRALLEAAMHQPLQHGTGPVQPRAQGLAQGAPLSPLLANLVLDGMDHALEARFGDALVRYADDFVLLLPSRAEAQQALEVARGLLGEMHLQLAPAKTTIVHAAEGFFFVGERFDHQGLAGTPQSVDGQRKPLVLTDPGLGLSLNGEAVDVRRDGALVQTVPLRRVSEILLFGRLHLSTALMERCARLRIPIAISLPGGRSIAALGPDSREFHDIGWLQARWYHGLATADRCAIAASLLQAKLAGYTALVSRRRPVDREVLQILSRCAQAADTAMDVAALRGHEGVAARACFAWLQAQFKPDAQAAFSAPRRAREGGERLNGLLNFGYYLSFTHLSALVRAHGLNPYLGFLHDGLDDYETLVADLQELVRPFIDRLVIQLVNMGIVRAQDFTPVPRGLYLTTPAARKVAQAFERMMGEDAGGQPLRDSLLRQVRVLRQYMCHEGPRWWFHMGQVGEETAAQVSHGRKPQRSGPLADAAGLDGSLHEMGAVVDSLDAGKDDDAVSGVDSP